MNFFLLKLKRSKKCCFLPLGYQTVLTSLKICCNGKTCVNRHDVKSINEVQGFSDEPTQLHNEGITRKND